MTETKKPRRSQAHEKQSRYRTRCTRDRRDLPVPHRVPTRGRQPWWP